MIFTGADCSWLKPLTSRFDQAIEDNRLGHAPMLIGPPGVGKAWLADWLALRLLCLSPVDGNACGQCRSCELLPNATHPDFFRLDILEDKTVILVEQVRDLIDSLNLTPSIGNRRVGLIQSADHMNANAANALLKTLEEPAQEIWLILISERPGQLPATIRSRCQQFTIPLPPADEALAWLKQHASAQDEDQFELALMLAEGSPQTAAQWLNEGQMDFALNIRKQLNQILQQKPAEAALVSGWMAQPKMTWHWLARWSQAWMRMAMTNQADGLSTKHSQIRGAQAIEVLYQCWQQALEGSRLAEKPVRHDWLLESWLLHWKKLARLVQQA